jgi:hypothetical protein
MRKATIAVALVFFGLVIGSFTATSGQDPKRDVSHAGRFQGAIGNDQYGTLYLFDTATGQVWRNIQGDWAKFGKPVKEK